MSFLYFGATLSLIDAATPSTGSWVVAYDSDGVLKQKDEFGVITKIGGGSSNLAATLAQGNHTGTYSVV